MQASSMPQLTLSLPAALGALAFFYLFGMKFFANVAVDQYFWWWVIHLWVEGAWELIAAALYALLLIRLFDFPRERAARYVYLEAGLVLFTGILGSFLYQRRGSIDWRISVPVCAGALDQSGQRPPLGQAHFERRALADDVETHVVADGRAARGRHNEVHEL